MKILVIEDDAKAASLMSKGLTQEGFVVDTCNNGEDGLELAVSSKPDLMVLDIMLPKLDGWEVLKQMRRLGISMPILILTARDSVDHRVKGLTLGADDYIVKPFAFSELVARIRTVLRRSATALADELTFADLTLDTRRHKVLRGQISIDLSSKEFQLLELLLSHQGEVLSRSFISERVWDMSFEGDSNVVDVNIRRLRAKMDDAFPRKLIQTVRGRGYVIR
ncbi:MAG: heavy metal response regulator transcription factor [Hyphomicrobium sp.]|nr:heavy metal response regulator transcription factor [Hyphomicrobium sp.]